mgnify:CR=1 FL=1
MGLTSSLQRGFLKTPKTLSVASLYSIGVPLSCTAPTNASSAWGTANLALYVPFFVTEPLIVVQMFALNAGAVNGNIDVGIYGSTGTRLVSLAPAAASGANTIQTFNITDTTLQPGLYYMALSNSGTTHTFLSIIPSADAVDVIRTMGVFVETSAGTLPATATFAANTQAFIPYFGLTAESVL